MANGYVQVAPDGLGKKLDTEELVVSGSTVQRQRTEIVGAGATEIAVVTDSDPGPAAFGLCVRLADAVAIEGTVPISAAALPLPAGAATEAKQPDLGTAGAAAANVITVQGIASMTPVLVNGSGFTQPVSGTVGISGTVPVSGTVAISGTVPISAASLPLPTGAASDAGLAALLAELQFKADLAETQPVAIAPLTSCGSGKTTVTTAGTRVALGASTAIKSVTVKALSANTGLIYVGNATVAAANGFQLSAGDSVSLDVDNLTDINIDSAVNGEGVTYLWAT